LKRDGSAYLTSNLLTLSALEAEPKHDHDHPKTSTTEFWAEVMADFPPNHGRMLDGSVAVPPQMQLAKKQGLQEVDGFAAIVLNKKPQD